MPSIVLSERSFAHSAFASGAVHGHPGKARGVRGGVLWRVALDRVCSLHLTTLSYSPVIGTRQSGPPALDWRSPGMSQLPRHSRVITFGRRGPILPRGPEE